MGFFTGTLNLYAFYTSDAPYDLYTFGYYMYIKVINADVVSFPLISAMGLLMTAIVAPLTIISKHLLEKYGPTND